KNLKIKLTVFVIAIFIWFFVVTENDYEYIIDVPVYLMNIPKNKILINEIPEKAKVKIHGNGKALIALNLSRSARVELDLSGIDSVKTFYLKPGDVLISRASGNIQVREVLMPDSITVKLDDIMIKKVPVISQITVQPYPGHTIVDSPEIQPDSINVKGAKFLVSKIDSVFTEAKVFKDLRFDLRTSVPLIPPSSPLVSYSANEVIVHYDVQKLMEITMSEIPVKVLNAPRNLVIHVVPSTLTLVLEGGAELLSQIKPGDILAYIDYQKVKYMGTNQLPAYIETPRGVSYRDVHPRFFKLVFERSSSR
ncbi:MAG: hypothetical protein D6813_05460, partial [Calditrichaeota bacterium]